MNATATPNMMVDSPMTGDAELDSVIMLAGLTGATPGQLRALAIITNPDASGIVPDINTVSTRTKIYDYLAGAEATGDLVGGNLVRVYQEALTACENTVDYIAPAYIRGLCAYDPSIEGYVVSLYATYSTALLPTPPEPSVRNTSHVTLSYLDQDIETDEPQTLIQVLTNVAFWLDQWETPNQQAIFLSLTKRP